MASRSVRATAVAPSSRSDNLLLADTSRNRTKFLVAVVRVGDIDIVVKASSLALPAGRRQSAALGQGNGLVRLWAVVVTVDVLTAGWRGILLPLVEVAERASVVGIKG
jgi:hypothetical protein